MSQIGAGWQDRKRHGRPSAEDEAAGRCLSLAEIAAIPDGAEVSVVWNGGNGPHRYRIARVDGWVTTTAQAENFNPMYDALHDPGRPAWRFAWVERV